MLATPGISVTTRIKNYFSSNDFKNDAAWVGLALSVAALTAFIAVGIVGFTIPESNNSKYIEEHPWVPGRKDLCDTGTCVGVLSATFGGILSALGVIGSIVAIRRNPDKKAGGRERIVSRSLIITALTLFVLGITLAQVAHTFQKVDSQQYYTPESFDKLQNSLTALRDAGITLSVFGAIAVGGTTLGLEGLKAIACAIRRQFLISTEQKTIASQRPNSSNEDPDIEEPKG